MKIKPRAAAVIPRGNSIVLVKHEKEGRGYWVPPGGAIEPSEKIKDAAAREVKEETNLSVTVKDMLYYQDFMRPKEHVLEFFFLCEIQSGKLSLGKDPEDEREKPMLRDVKYASVEDIRDMNILPKALKRRLLEDLPSGFDLSSPVYLNEVDK